jgi:hypothetical protein
MTSIDDLRKHVTDDAFQMMATVGLVTPLHTEDLRISDPRKLLLRRILSREVALILTRLHFKAGTGPTGVTASIDGVLDALHLARSLAPCVIDGFKTRRKKLTTDMESDGVHFDDLFHFRTVKLAHSLHALNPSTVDIAWTTILTLAEGTNGLVRDIEEAIVQTGASPLPLIGKEEYSQWIEHGRSLWEQRPIE